jgi:hypothetical protein
MSALDSTVLQLHASSVRNYVNPYVLFSWPDVLDSHEWCTSPELVSLCGTEFWEDLDSETRRMLAFYEAVNFFSLNVHGERQQMEGLARRLYDRDNDHLAPYLHHFIDEENKHNVVFAEFCLRYANKLYPHAALAFEREYASGEEDFLFFARILVFEEVAVSHNALMGRDERLAGIARAINHYHYVDEVRHLRFGRAVVSDLWRRFSPEWPPEVVARVRQDLIGFLRATWMQYYSTAAYRDAGIADAYSVRAAAFDHPACVRRRRELSRHCTAFLRSAQITEEEVLP